MCSQSIECNTKLFHSPHHRCIRPTRPRCTLCTRCKLECKSHAFSTSTLFAFGEDFDLKMAGDVLVSVSLSRRPVFECICMCSQLKTLLLAYIFPFGCSAPFVNHSFYLHLIRLSSRFVALNRFYHIFFWFRSFSSASAAAATAAAARAVAARAFDVSSPVRCELRVCDKFSMQTHSEWR